MNLLQSMRVFVEVVDRNGFGRAAQALQMATASVSVQIANLEHHLGICLLNRTTRNVVLTHEGSEYYKVSKRILDEIAEVEESFNKARSTPAGRLRVDAIDGHVINLIIPVLPEFMERYPKVCIDFVQSGHAFDTAETGADVMLRMYQGSFADATSLVAKPIGYTEYMCVASPAYLEEYGTPRTPHDLTQHNCIMWIDPHTGRRWEWNFERNGESVLIDLPNAFAFSLRQARVEAAIRGLGVLYEDSFMVAQAMHEGKLTQILQDWSPSPTSIYICYNQNLQHSTKVQAFVNFVLEKYPPDKALIPPLRNALSSTPGTASA